MTGILLKSRNPPMGPEEDTSCLLHRYFFKNKEVSSFLCLPTGNNNLCVAGNRTMDLIRATDSR